MPAVLLIFKVANDGVLVEFKTGDIDPLKLMTPEELDRSAFSNLIFCTAVPMKVVIPLLVIEPLLVRSPYTDELPLPALNDAPVITIRLPLKIMLHPSAV